MPTKICFSCSPVTQRLSCDLLLLYCLCCVDRFLACWSEPRIIAIGVSRIVKKHGSIPVDNVLQGSIAAAMSKNLQNAGHSLFVCSDEYERIWDMFPTKSVPGMI
jgi:hypothetical protein